MERLSPIQYVPIIGGAFVGTFVLYAVIKILPNLRTNVTDSETDEFTRDVNNPQESRFPVRGGKTKRLKRKGKPYNRGI